MIEPEAWLRYFAHHFGSVVCRGQTQYLAFAPYSSEVAFGILVFLYLVHNLPQLHMHTGEGNGTPLQYCCLANPMDGEAWWAAVHGVAKSQT